MLQWGRRFLSAERKFATGQRAGGELLQWGRRFLSAESVHLMLLASSHVDASMGPPIFIGGKEAKILGDINELFPASMGPPIFIGGKLHPAHKGDQNMRLLQWGRRFLSAESMTLYI